MVRIRRATTAALIACVIATQGVYVFASDEEHAPSLRTPSHLTYDGKPLTTFRPLVSAAPLESHALDQWGGYYGRGRGRNRGAATAIFLGAVGTIAGAAVLVYADRPECSANVNLDGCGYGTKVIGGAVLSAGLVGLMVGALTWR
jgi:hypothetical protein